MSLLALKPVNIGFPSCGLLQDWWGWVSFGLLGYEMDRTHSIMRIATTASPVSGAAIRGRMINLAIESQFKRATNVICNYIDRRLKEQAENARNAARISRRRVSSGGSMDWMKEKYLDQDTKQHLHKVNVIGMDGSNSSARRRSFEIRDENVFNLAKMDGTTV